MPNNDESENIQLKPLIQKRGQLKSSLTRFKSFLESHVRGSSTYQLKVRLSKIEECWVEFKDIQSQIEALDLSDIQTQERESFEDQYFELSALGQEYIEENAQSQVNIHTPMPTPAEAASSSAIQVRLPAISLPSFSGNVEDWISFSDSFKSLIHSNTGLNDTQKLHYLRSSLSGDAAKVIYSLESSATNYDVAWHLLEDRYKNRKVIILKHVKSLFDLPSVERESYTGLRQLLDGTLMHLRALTALEEPTESWNTLLIYLITNKLNQGILREWDLTTEPDKVPKLSHLTDFLQRRCQIFENSSSSKITSKPNVFLPKIKTVQKTCMTTQNNGCRLCSGPHAIFQCKKLLNAPQKERYQLLREAGVCFNCLRPGHTVAQCQSRGCKRCSSKHNTILHISPSSLPEASSQLRSSSSATQGIGQSFTAHSSTMSQNTSQILLSTAIVDVISPSGQSLKCRALIDNGSQSCFMTEHVAQQLCLRKTRGSYRISGINQTTVDINGVAEASVRSYVSNFRISLSFLIVPRITGELPTEKILIDQLAIPSHVVLADPTFGTPGRIDLLIGQEVFLDLLSIGQIKSHGMPTLQKTRLGWIVGGRFGTTHPMTNAFTTCHLSTTDKVNQQLEKFWLLEEPTASAKLTSEELSCEDHFVVHTRRDETGRYVVHMPLKTNPTELGNSKDLATRRFMQVEKRLVRDKDLGAQYKNFMQEYIDLGHMERVTDEPNQQAEFFLPHHPVVKELSTTTKLRVVFDASAKTSTGVSLNDIQLVGPTVQSDLFSITLRFRMHTYVMTADLEKMYRQILVDPSQKNLLKIIWRSDVSKPLETYRLNTVTYGTASAPYLATRTINQLAEDEGGQFPVAARILKRDFYVDDLLTGTNTKEEGISLQQELIELVSKGGFNLRKWASNSKDLLMHVQGNDVKHHFQELSKDENSTIKTLGLWWNSSEDEFLFRYSPSQRKDQNHLSKRIVLSEIARIFDPLGLVAPIVVRAKMQLQELWKLKLSWDESLPMHIHTQWFQFLGCLTHLNDLRIRRQVTIPNMIGSFEIHGFADASERAYGGAVYVRQVGTTGYANVNLLCSKSRVAPVNTISLPRLELCAALLLSELVSQVIYALQTEPQRIVYWTDSTVALSWISAEPARWTTFVANRVTKIQDLSNSGEWRHVRTNDNPADLVSRGARAQNLALSKLWWQGPEWLKTDQEHWPKTQSFDGDIPEERRPARVSTFVLTQQNETLSVLIDRHSSFNKLSRVLAYCLRFLHNSKQSKKEWKTGPLTPSDLDSATRVIIKFVQVQEFSKEIVKMKSDKGILHTDKLISLAPFLDKDEIIRVGGRLQQAPLAYDIKHPILLPRHNRVTEMIARQEHLRNLHCGPQALLYALRQRYWPINGRDLTRKIVHQCTTCFKAKPKHRDQLMGELPASRVTPTRPFLHTGVDYCGPFHVKQSKIRSAKLTKTYVAVFICLSTKAVHLELVGDLTSDSFIAALKRFVSRRGVCARIYSDNGKNFVGANRELKELHTFFKAEMSEIVNKATLEGVQWSFNPPYAPHMGGLWEAAVKSLKFHLRRIVGNASLSFEELTTVLTQVEAVLNSRPLTPISNDPSDLTVLTPAHFLTGGSLTALPEPSLMLLPEQRLSRWQRVQKLLQHFWTRWSKEYLNTLQQRKKWKVQSLPLTEGSLVLLKEDNIPPLSWLLGRIIRLHPGKDGLTRVATVKTVSSEVKRCVSKLCPLPMET